MLTKRGRRVTWWATLGKQLDGTIIGTRGHYLRVRFDGVRRSNERRMAQHRHRFQSGIAETLHRQRAEPFRQRVPVGTDQQAVMPKRRRRCAHRLKNRPTLHRPLQRPP